MTAAGTGGESCFSRDAPPPSTFALRPSTFDLRPSTFDLRLQTFDVRRPTSDLRPRRPTSDIGHRTSDIGHPASKLDIRPTPRLPTARSHSLGTPRNIWKPADAPPTISRTTCMPLRGSQGRIHIENGARRRRSWDCAGPKPPSSARASPPVCRRRRPRMRKARPR
ncbi:L-arabinose ABC transporter, periplasmic L-arabinose-binding protein [Burkholderia pseudomallei 1710a]|uniref:L-arabinose ABC transporter, periplasmic L-arabinose-binding protein n=1 Tax=Burkholderia pseudomallei 1710a TaxID=320371 RepID=A0A0E1VQV9_BURPE|nr:L-arabinose ABC transporter, periplasmic L-arabinose-binding protein [Burkholderia pseudomallei 1710a]